MKQWNLIRSYGRRFWSHHSKKMPLIIILLAISIAGLMVLSKKAPRRGPKKRAARVVDFVLSSVEDQSFFIKSHGWSRAFQNLPMSLEIGGVVNKIHPKMKSGETVATGEALFSIDPLNYELAYQRALSDRARANYEYKLALANKKVFEKEHTLIKQNMPPRENTPQATLLARRLPQLNFALASLSAAKVAVEHAKSRLDKTEFKAPFDGHLTQTNLSIGQILSPGQVVGMMQTLSPIEIYVSLPIRSVEALSFGDLKKSPRNAKVSKMVGKKTHYWQGRVVRKVDKIEEQTSLIKVVVEVIDPLSDKQLKMPIGLFCDVEIEGTTLTGGRRIPRRALREGDTVWIVDSSNTLQPLRVGVKHLEKDHAYVHTEDRTPLKVVTSPDINFYPGMPVRTAEL